MKRWICAVVLGMAVAVGAPATAGASTIFIDFEGLAEAQPPTASGVTFTNALVLTAPPVGQTIDAAIIPPHSGDSVAMDLVSWDLNLPDPVSAGPMVLVFSTPVTTFSGWFTYSTGLTLTGFDGATLIAGPTRAGSNLGSNEEISFTYNGGLTRIEILGSPNGNSFAVDDITLEEAVVVAPRTRLDVASRPGSGGIGPPAREGSPGGVEIRRPIGRFRLVVMGGVWRRHCGVS